MGNISLKQLSDQRETLDPGKMWDAIASFADQLEAASRISLPSEIPYASQDIENIVFCGMGGSAIGGDLLNAYFRNELIVPMEVNRNYTLPNYVSPNTLVIVSSYSGNTEETLSSYLAAQEAGAMIIGITSGGELAELLQDKKLPWIRIPGGMQPRAALGYSFIPMAKLLNNLDFAGGSIQEDIRETISLVRDLSKKYQSDSKNNTAIRLAEDIYGTVPIIYTDPELAAVGTRWKGQLAENAKMLAFTHQLPEMNHNEVVGWETQQKFYNQTRLVWLCDENSHSAVQARRKITGKLLQEIAGHQNTAQSSGKSWLARLFSLIHLGDWVSLYVSLAGGVDPTPVDRISLLKQRLAREN